MIWELLCIYIHLQDKQTKIMKKLMIPSVAIVLLLASAFTFKAAQSWKIADGYKVAFSSADPSGVFNDLKGNVLFDENDLANSKFDVVIDVNSINTGNGMQNKHAVSANWFDAATYPSIKFTSSSIIKGSAGFMAKGILDMHGVQKEITIPFTVEKSSTGATFNGSFEVNRNDWKIGEPGGKASEVIKLSVSVPVTKQ